MNKGWLALPLALGIGIVGAQAQTNEVTFAHQDMVVPMRTLMASGELERATGYKINWKMIVGGGDVIKSMASGQVPIAEVGSSPATAAIAQGMDVEIIWILNDIGNAEQLIAREGTGINSVPDLKGKKVATPFVSTTHYHLLAALEDAGVNPREVQILNLRPAEVAAAWERGDIDATFIWNPVLSRIKGNGKVLLSSGELAKNGKPTFDAILVNRTWAKQNKDFLTKFIAAIAKADADYVANKEKWTPDSEMVQATSKIVGAKPEDVPPAMGAYNFPSAAEQASKTWLGGGKDSGVAKAIMDTAKFLKAQGRITELPSDPEKFVNSEFAAAAAKLVE